MVELILFFALLNLALGYALAAGLADPPFGGFTSWDRWRQLLPHIHPSLPRIVPGSPMADVAAETHLMEYAEPDRPELSPQEARSEAYREVDEEPAAQLPPVAVVEELPPAWRDLLSSERLSPRWFADAVASALSAELVAYRQHALAAEARARLVLAQENAEAVEQLVADFRFLHHEWLTRLLEGAELLSERRGRYGPAEIAARWLAELLFDHAAEMESIDRAISELSLKTDTAHCCRRLLEELLELVAGIHRLRDSLSATLAAILRAQETLADLSHDQQLDPLTGRVNRLGLEATFRPSAGPRQALLIAWDRFCLVNERLGTRAGDRVLRTFSQLLTDLLEGTGAAGEIVRLAGTRFLLLLDGISREQAVIAAEQVRQSLEGVTLDWQGATLDVSVRIGVTSVAASDTLEQLLLRLDRAVEAAELAGGNRCAVATEKETRVVAPHQVAVIARPVEVEEAGDLVGQLH